MLSQLMVGGEIGAFILFSITLLIVIFFAAIFYSLFKNRESIKFYEVLTRNGQISKVGISWIFILLITIYQILVNGTLNSELVQLLLIVFGAELGTDAVSLYSKHINIKDTDKPVSAKANNSTSVDDIKGL